MNYTVTIPQQHLLYILAMLENVAAPLKQTAPVHENLARQMREQDAANAIPVPGVFVDDDTSGDELIAKHAAIQRAMAGDDGRPALLDNQA